MPKDSRARKSIIISIGCETLTCVSQWQPGDRPHTSTRGHSPFAARP